jgi:hypothetical protein
MLSSLTTKEFDIQKFNLTKLNEAKGEDGYQAKVLNKFSALENLDDYEDMSRAWETIKWNINISANENLG